MALTKVGPAGIGSTPGTGYVIGDSFLHSTGLDSTNAKFTGIVTAQTFRVLGNFQVDGTTTTLDTEVTSVDKLEVAANNTTVGVAITQSGSGDIFNLYDGTTEVFTVRDGGNIGIKNATGVAEFAVDVGDEIASKNANKEFIGINLVSNEARIRSSFYSGASGAYRPITFYTSDAERLRISAAGRVGIGISSPAYLAHIHNAGTGSGDHSYLHFTTGDTGATGSDGLTLGIGANQTAYINFRESGPLVLSTSGTERLRIASDGKVGIGTNVPAELLHLNGATNKSLLRFTSGSYGTASTDGSHVGINFGGLELWHKENNYLRFGTNNTERLRVTSAGRIGIGTATPDSILALEGTGSDNATRITIKDGTGIAEVNGRYGNLILDSDRDNAVNGSVMIFQIDNDEKVRITSGGKFGIGTVNPQEQFVVSNSGAEGFEVSAGVASNVNKIVNYNRSGGSYSSLRIDAAEHIFRIGASERLRVNSAGNVTIGGNSNPDWNSTVDALTVGYAGVLYEDSYSSGTDNYVILGNNVYYPGGGNKYIRNDEASRIMMHSGTFYFQNAGAGTAGNSITFADRFRITSDGKVGINQASPSEKLEVYAGDILLSSNANGISGGVGPNAAIKFEYNGHQYAKIVGNGRDSSGYGDIDFYTSNSAGVSNLTQRMTIRADGKVGINDTNPAYQLSIEGTGAVRNEITCTDNSGAGAGVYFRTMNGGSMVSNATIRTDNAGNLQFYTGTSSDSERLRINSSGDLQFSAGNNIQMASNGRIFVGNGGNATDPMFANVSDTNTGIAFPAADTMLFTTGGTERMRIRSDGKVEINSNGNYGSGAMALNVGSRAQNIAGSLAIARGETLGGGTGPYMELVHGPDGGTQRTHSIYSYIGDLRIWADAAENLEISGVETKIKDSSRNDVAIFNANGLEMEKNTARLFGRYVGKTNTASNYELTHWTAGSFRILEVFGFINPNSSGSFTYYDPAHFYVYNATGWNGSATSYYLGIKHVAPGARTYAPSGTGADPTQNIVAKWGNNNSTATTNGGHYLKFEWSGANTSNNYQAYFRVIRRM